MILALTIVRILVFSTADAGLSAEDGAAEDALLNWVDSHLGTACLLYTSPSPRD